MQYKYSIKGVPLLFFRFESLFLTRKFGVFVRQRFKISLISHFCSYLFSETSRIRLRFSDVRDNFYLKY